jgi:hypothetical protein
VVEKPLEDQNVSCISPHVVKSVILKDFEIKFVLNNGLLHPMVDITAGRLFIPEGITGPIFNVLEWVSYYY